GGTPRWLLPVVPTAIAAAAGLVAEEPGQVDQSAGAAQGTERATAAAGHRAQAAETGEGTAARPRDEVLEQSCSHHALEHLVGAVGAVLLPAGLEEPAVAHVVAQLRRRDPAPLGGVVERPVVLAEDLLAPPPPGPGLGGHCSGPRLPAALLHGGELIDLGPQLVELLPEGGRFAGVAVVGIVIVVVDEVDH